MLKTASCQNDWPIEEFYRWVVRTGDAFGPDGAASMLDLLPELAEVCKSIDVWALRSLDRLCLLAEDDYRAPWFVIVAAGGDGAYDIEYRMRPTEAPWPSARVSGQASSKAEALE